MMFKTDTTTLVERILQSYPRARQDDKYLMLKVWDEQGFRLPDELVYKFMSKDISSSESIRRTRQKLQEQGKYLPPKAVQEARKELEKETRVEMVQARLI